MDKETWKNLTGKSQWDVTVALRGPDVKRSEVIKSFTTSVIRSCMSRVIRVGGQLSDYGFVLLPSGSVFKAPKQDPNQPVVFLRPDMDHFLGHIGEAAEILGIPVIAVPPDVWEDIMLAPSPQSGMSKFLLYLKDHSEVFIPAKVQDRIEELKQAYGLSEAGVTPTITLPSVDNTLPSGWVYMNSLPPNTEPPVLPKPTPKDYYAKYYEKKMKASLKNEG